MKKIIKLPEEGLKGLHFFTHNLNFPVVAAAYTEWEHTQLTYLESNFQTAGFTTESLCGWCIRHQIKYQIMYPLSKVTILKNPYKIMKFIQLKQKLKMCSL